MRGSLYKWLFCILALANVPLCFLMPDATVLFITAALYLGCFLFLIMLIDKIVSLREAAEETISENHLKRIGLALSYFSLALANTIPILSCFMYSDLTLPALALISLSLFWCFIGLVYLRVVEPLPSFQFTNYSYRKRCILVSMLLCLPIIYFVGLSTVLLTHSKIFNLAG